jgi:hypothetical protein
LGQFWRAPSQHSHPSRTKIAERTYVKVQHGRTLERERERPRLQLFETCKMFYDSVDRWTSETRENSRMLSLTSSK